MDNEKFQELVLKQLQVLTEGQAKMDARIGNIETDVRYLKTGQDRMQKDIDQMQEDINRMQKDIDQMQEDIDGIKNELSYVWGDIKKIDNRLSVQEEEVVILKRLK